MLGCENTVIEGVDWHQDDDGGPQLAVTVRVRPAPAAGRPAADLREEAAGL